MLDSERVAIATNLIYAMMATRSITETYHGFRDQAHRS
jgi:hypothetical protein